MARIRIDDLSSDQTLDAEALDRIRGGTDPIQQVFGLFLGRPAGGGLTVFDITSPGGSTNRGPVLNDRAGAVQGYYSTFLDRPKP